SLWQRVLLAKRRPRLYTTMATTSFSAEVYEYRLGEPCGYAAFWNSLPLRRERTLQGPAKALGACSTQLLARGSRAAAERSQSTESTWSAVASTIAAACLMSVTSFPVGL